MKQLFNPPRPPIDFPLHRPLAFILKHAELTDEVFSIVTTMNPAAAVPTRCDNQLVTAPVTVPVTTPPPAPIAAALILPHIAYPVMNPPTAPLIAP